MSPNDVSKYKTPDQDHEDPTKIFKNKIGMIPWCGRLEYSMSYSFHDLAMILLRLRYETLKSLSNQSLS